MVRYPVLFLAVLVAGCADWPEECENPYVLKGDGEAYDKVIRDPYKWVSRQFEESCPVTCEIMDGVKRVKLQEAVADLDHDGKPELFLGNGPARGWMVVVFTRVLGGYRCMGDFSGSAFRILPKDNKGHPRVLVFEPCGGHLCYVKTYTHNGKRFECTSSEEMTCGDGAPEENNQKLEKLFGFDSGMPECLKWRWRVACTRLCSPGRFTVAFLFLCSFNEHSCLCLNFLLFFF